MMKFQLLDKNKKLVGPLYNKACLLQLPEFVEKHQLNDVDKWKYIRYTMANIDGGSDAYISQFSKVLFFGEYLKKGVFSDEGQYSLDLDCDVIPQFELNSILNVLRYWDEQYLYETISFKRQISENPKWTAQEFMICFLDFHYLIGFGSGHSLFSNCQDPEYNRCSFTSLIKTPKENPKLDKTYPRFFQFNPRTKNFSSSPLWSYYTPANISKE